MEKRLIYSFEAKDIDDFINVLEDELSIIKNTRVVKENATPTKQQIKQRFEFLHAVISRDVKEDLQCKAITYLIELENMTH